MSCKKTNSDTIIDRIEEIAIYILLTVAVVAIGLFLLSLIISIS